MIRRLLDLLARLREKLIRLRKRRTVDRAPMGVASTAAQPPTEQRVPPSYDTRDDPPRVPIASSATAQSAAGLQTSKRRRRLIMRLREKGTLRDAILLNEILQKPVALRQPPERRR